MVPCYCFRLSCLILPTLDADISSSLQQPQSCHQVYLLLCMLNSQPSPNTLSRRPLIILAAPIHTLPSCPFPLGHSMSIWEQCLGWDLPYVDQVRRKKKNKKTVSQTVHEMTMCSPTVHIQRQSWCTFVADYALKSHRSLPFWYTSD